MGELTATFLTEKLATLTVPSPKHMECTPVVADHDYCSVPEPAGLDMAAIKKKELQKEIVLLHRELKELNPTTTFVSTQGKC